MNLLKVTLTTGLVLAVTVCIGTFISVSAQDGQVTPQMTEQIISSCVSTKNTLKQLHASDALLRVNRGQIYESISTKLMSGFNSRVSNNGLNNSNLTSATNGYNSTLDTFRADYIAYEESLASAINVDCTNHPVIFYNAIATARDKRGQVHDDITRLNQSVDQYQDAVNQFEKDFQGQRNGN